MYRMGKKCIPGVMCIENMTLFVLFVILIMFTYLYYIHFVKDIYRGSPNGSGSLQTNTVNTVAKEYVLIPAPSLATVATRNNPMTDIYSPPLKNDGVYFPPDSGDVRGLPVNVRTRGIEQNYSQIGILTRLNGGGGDLILPLMGRQATNGRDKRQYYTMSATGNLNTKLPVSLKGKSCTSEYGCDEINNGDVVYVEGYNDTFRATVYENGLFSYIPYI